MPWIGLYIVLPFLKVRCFLNQCKSTDVNNFLPFPTFSPILIFGEYNVLYVKNSDFTTDEILTPLSGGYDAAYPKPLSFKAVNKEFAPRYWMQLFHDSPAVSSYLSLKPFSWNLLLYIQVISHYHLELMYSSIISLLEFRKVMNVKPCKNTQLMNINFRKEKPVYSQLHMVVLKIALNTATSLNEKNIVVYGGEHYV